MVHGLCLEVSVGNKYCVDASLMPVIYYVICYSHGDFSPEHLGQPDWLPCISEIDGFAATFLFSLETQHTIGYGTRQTTTNCPHAILLMSLQVCTLLLYIYVQ